MSNWIVYLEEYRCNRTVLENLQYDPIASKGNETGTHPETSDLYQNISAIKQKISETEHKLEHYIPADAPKSEISRLADEKLFLSLRYICGMSMLETASAMCVSRDTVYRIRRRVLTRKLPE